jgi:hypothetical protein
MFCWGRSAEERGNFRGSVMEGGLPGFGARNPETALIALVKEVALWHI